MDYWKKLCPTHIFALNSDTTLYYGDPIKRSATNYKLDHSNLEGDFAVADHKIDEGTLILEEYPYVFQVHDKHSNQVCPGCLSSMTGIRHPIFCRQRSCSWKLHYCSPLCEDRHWFSVHMYVCPFRASFGKSQQLLLAFQMWIQSMTTQMVPSSTATVTTNSNSQTKINSKRMESLTSNLNLHSEIDLQRYKLDAISLSRLFSFSVHDTKDMQERLTRYQAMIRCNGFGIQRRIMANYASKDVSTSDVTMDTVATSIYLLASKFNHSCQPNVLALFLSTKLQLRATRPILPGQSLCISYGPLAANLPISQRQEQLLEHYFFKCHCQACQAVPDPSIPPSIDQIYLCPHCKYNRVCRLASTCPQCKKGIDWDKIRKVERSIRIHQDDENWEKVLQLQLEIYHDETLYLGKTYDQLALQHYSSNRQLEAFKYCEISVRIVQRVYGESSPEAAEEMYKLCGIASMSTLDVGKKRFWIKKTRDLYSLLGLDQQLPEDKHNLDDMYNYT